MYTIGEFASINKISTRMLRHYDKIGLFKPVTILPNGYRAYSSMQLEALSQIKLYQSCGFTLSEIQTLLKADEEQIKTLAQKKLSELHTRDLGNNSAYALLSGFLEKQQPAFENRYAFSYTFREEQLWFLCEVPVPEDKIETSFELLYDTLHTLAAVPTGPALLLCGAVKDALYYTAAPIKTEYTHTGFTCKTIAHGWYLSTFHFGSYDSIAAAYDRLLCYAAEHHKNITLPFIERYFLDRIHTLNPNEYITEVSVKLLP